MNPWYIFENCRVLKYRTDGKNADLWSDADDYLDGSWYKTQQLVEDRRSCRLEVVLLYPQVPESTTGPQTSTEIDDQG